MYVIIVGSGLVARSLGRRLSMGGNQIAFVVEDTREAEQMADRFPRALVIRGSGADEVALQHARAEDCDALFAVSEDDSQTMVACLLARERFGIEHVVALALDCEHVPAFAALNIHSVCGPDVVVEALVESASPVAVGGE